MHPEVKYSLLILLYAGISLKIYNYFIQKKNKNIVKKLYIWDNQQEMLLKEVPVDIVCGAEDRSLKNNNRSSETIRNNINKLYRDKITEHIPKHKKPLNDKELGYYLAGLIDGIGEINDSNIIIYFNKNDNSLAYWLKKSIGYGKIKHIINNKSLNECNETIHELKLVITKIDGLVRILELINGKLKIKYNEVNKNLLLKNKLVNEKYYKKNNEFINGNINDMNNYWLVGLIDSTGNLKVILKNMEVPATARGAEAVIFKLNICIISNKLINEELNEIKKFICNINNKTSNVLYKGVNIISNSILSNIEESEMKKVRAGTVPPFGEMGTGCDIENKFINNLETVSLKLAKNIISYLSKYHLQSYKYLNYIYFYKIYLLKKNKLSSTVSSHEEIEKSILKIKEYISRMR